MARFSDERKRIYEEYLLKIAHDKMIKENMMSRKIKQWKEIGSSIVYPDQVGAWKIYVDNRAKDIFEGKDIEDALVTMKALESGMSVNDAVGCFEGNENSNFYYKIIAQTVGYFSKRGVEFYKQIYNRIFHEKLDEPMQNFINQIEKKNLNSELALQSQNQ